MCKESFGGTEESIWREKCIGINTNKTILNEEAVKSVKQVNKIGTKKYTYIQKIGHMSGINL